MKQKRYWLRGGLIALCILLVLYVIDTNHFISPLTRFKIPGGNLWLVLDFARFFCGGRKCADIGGIIHIVTSPISHFVLGSMAGLIYGKIKNRNKVGSLIK